MYLYKVEQNGQYDTYNYIVVVAKEEQLAISTSPEGEGFINKIRNSLWDMCSRNLMTVTLLGEVNEGVHEGCMYESMDESFDITPFKILLKSL